MKLQSHNIADFISIKLSSNSTPPPFLSSRHYAFFLELTTAEMRPMRSLPTTTHTASHPRKNDIVSFNRMPCTDTAVMIFEAHLHPNGMPPNTIAVTIMFIILPLAVTPSSGPTIPNVIAISAASLISVKIALLTDVFFIVVLLFISQASCPWSLFFVTSIRGFSTHPLHTLWNS